MRMQPLLLAFVGDAVHHLYVRAYLVVKHRETVHRLHIRASECVMASAQADTLSSLYERFSEEEQEVFRRGRNAKSNTLPKNATRKQYHEATGFEAVLGYLYLTGRHERLMEILGMAMQAPQDGGS